MLQEKAPGILFNDKRRYFILLASQGLSSRGTAYSTFGQARILETDLHIAQCDRLRLGFRPTFIFSSFRCVPSSHMKGDHSEGYGSHV